MPPPPSLKCQMISLRLRVPVLPCMCPCLCPSPCILGFALGFTLGGLRAGFVSVARGAGLQICVSLHLLANVFLSCIPSSPAVHRSCLPWRHGPTCSRAASHDTLTRLLTIPTDNLARLFIYPLNRPLPASFDTLSFNLCPWRVQVLCVLSHLHVLLL